jgi:sentrin-specific protease 8
MPSNSWARRTGNFLEMSVYRLNDIQLYDHVFSIYKDLSTLEDRGWINDQIIEFYYEYLSMTHKDAQFIGPCAAYLASHDPESIQVTGSLVFIPVNNNSGNQIGGTHWSLLVYQRDINTFYSADSMHPTNIQCAKRYQIALEKSLGVIQSNFEILQVPRQANGYDCGIHVLINTERLLLNTGDESASSKRLQVKQLIKSMRI